MNVLELFAGSRSVGKVAAKLGHNVFSVDWKEFNKIDLVKDIEFLKCKDIPFIPDVVWASFDCTTYSIAAISHHRTGTVPKSKYAIKSDLVNINAINVIKEFNNINADLKFFIENPVGMLHKMPFMKEFDRAKIFYCRYVDMRMKPTYIFTNHLWTMYNQEGWKPRKKCWNNNKKCHHEASPRGSRTGTQGLKNDYERGKVPEALCTEILNSVKNQNKLNVNGISKNNIL